MYLPILFNTDYCKVLGAQPALAKKVVVEEAILF